MTVIELKQLVRASLSSLELRQATSQAGTGGGSPCPQPPQTHALEPCSRRARRYLGGGLGQDMVTPDVLQQTARVNMFLSYAGTYHGNAGTGGRCWDGARGTAGKGRGGGLERRQESRRRGCELAGPARWGERASGSPRWLRRGGSVLRSLGGPSGGGAGQSTSTPPLKRRS